jgi:hypothetical protein
MFGNPDGELKDADGLTVHPFVIVEKGASRVASSLYCTFVWCLMTSTRLPICCFPLFIRASRRHVRTGGKQSSLPHRVSAAIKLAGRSDDSTRFERINMHLLGFSSLHSIVQYHVMVNAKEAMDTLAGIVTVRTKAPVQASRSTSGLGARRQTSLPPSPCSATLPTSL